MEDIFSVIWRGLAVGLFVSAPMGPVGILCIQRTLTKGRRTGLYTGIGAAISDFIYCLLTGFGLAFIEDFLEKNQNVIQLIGSAVLIGFAVYLFRKAPVPARRKHEVESGSPSKDILGGFLFTFSNPLILFLIIGLFARFNFLGPGHKAYHYIIGYIAIVAGALGWWWVVTYFVDKLRGVFNDRSLRLINRGIGVVILIFALVGIVTSLGSLPIFGATASGPAFVYPPTESIIPDRISFKTTSEARKTGWRLIAEGKEGAGLEITLVPHKTPEDPDPLFDSARTPIIYSLTVRDAVSGRCLAESAPAPGIPGSGSDCSWRLTRSGDSWTLHWGKHTPDNEMGFAFPPFVLDSIAFRPLGIELQDADANAAGYIYDLIARGKPEPEYYEEARTEEMERVKEACNLEGSWALHDYELDNDLLETGGEYILRGVKTPQGYRLAYVSGADIAPGQWKPGRTKAILETRPGGISYNVIWFDPDGEVLGNGVASIDGYSGALVIQFPNRNSKVRFIRVD